MSSPSAHALFRVEHLTKRYGRFTALSDVSFSIRRGEVLGLIGPNGAGKTTLFECMGGVSPFEHGRVSDGDGARLDARECSSLMFYLPDAITPWPSQTVEWALDFAVGFFGADRDARGNVIGQLDLKPLLRTRIGQLSKGQRKRTLLGLGLLMPQPVLLADEPFEGLDLRQGRDVARTLRMHASAGRTLVLSIHQITDAARVCDRFVLLSGGCVRGEGSLDELSARAREHDGAVASDLEEVFLALT